MDFPRPNPDTGFGFHDSADAYWKPDDWPEYARMLRSHGATWFLMWTFDEKEAGWARELRQNGIEVIVRLGPAYMPRPQIDMAVVDAYIAAGVRWFILGNEYNLLNEWTTEGGWQGMEKPIRHIADWFVRIAQEITGKGAWCLTPPPSLGGHWLHREWFERFMYALQEIARERSVSMEQLLWHCGIGIHCRSCGNPLEAQPSWYDCSVNEYKWFDEMVKRFVGHSLPMANCEWGDEPGWSKRLNPQFDNRQKWDWWFNRNIEQVKWCNPANPIHYPDHIFANTFWILHSPPPWEDCSLIHNTPYLFEMGGSDITPLWDALPGVVTWNRLTGGAPMPEPVPVPVPVPQPPPTPSTDIDFKDLSAEMIDALSVSGPAEKTQPHWQVQKVEVQPETDNMSLWVIVPERQPLPPVLFWGGGEAPMSWKENDAYAPPGCEHGAYEQPMHDNWGLYGVRMPGNSEALFGFGLYGPNLETTYTAHRPTLVYYGFVSGTVPEPPVVPPEPSEPPIVPSIPYEFGSALSTRLVAAGLGKLVDVRDAIEKKYARIAECGVRSVDADKRLAGFWSITFHHDKITYPLDVMAIAKEHTVVRGWAHIGYHFILDRAGTVWWTKRLRYYGPHSGDGRFNKYSVPVAVHGDFTIESPSVAQLKALKCVTDTLEEWVGEHQGKPQPLPIVRHKDIVNTECPGYLYEQYRQYLDK